MKGLPSKTALARKLGIARSTLYYESRKKAADESDRSRIEAVLESNPSYGHRRIAIELGMNRKKVLRLMKKFGLKPKICRNRKFFKPGDVRLPEAIYRNEIAGAEFKEPDIAWAGDFTYIRYKNSFIYLATVIDICTREIIGSAISRWHSRHLVKSALLEAIKKRGRLPRYFHSDQGSEYRSEEHADYLAGLGVVVSMSRKSSPWQNGRQESLYAQFKLELGNPNRFEDENRLCEAIWRQIYYYNHKRIHTSLGMPPARFYALAAKGRD